MTSFVATAGAVETLDDTFLVVLAETEDGDTRIEFQRGLTFDAQDKALGMDTYCLCTEKGTYYGGAQSWQVSEGCLHLSLNAAAAKALRLDTEVSIALQLPENTVDQVTAGIERVLNLPMST